MDQRDSKREVVGLEVTATFKGKHCRALLYDLSMDGCTVHTGGRFALHAGDTIHFDVPHAGATRATVIWTKGQFGGAQFTERLDQAVVTKLGFRPHTPPDTAFHDQYGRPVLRLVRASASNRTD